MFFVDYFVIISRIHQLNNYFLIFGAAGSVLTVLPMSNRLLTLTFARHNPQQRLEI
jgi:hypothetical protein